MPADIVVMSDCASNYGVFHVKSSDGKNVYVVSFNGSEGPAYCTCKAFEFSGAKRSCKHIEKIWKEACLFNPQWHDGKESPTIKPVGYNCDMFVTHRTCLCGGPMVAVRRAV